MMAILLGMAASPALAQVDLYIEKDSALPNDVLYYTGDVLGFSVEITNPSLTIDADDVIAIDQLPSDHIGFPVFGAPFNVMITHGTYSYDAGARLITWNDIDLAAGETATMTYEVSVVTPFENPYSNRAEITSVGWVFDPDLSNNTTTFHFEVLEAFKFPANSAVQALVACENSAGDWHILAGEFNGRFLRSVPEGYLPGNRRWSSYSTGLPTYSDGTTPVNLVVNDLFIAPDGAVFASVWGYDGLYRTEDCGRSWNTVDFPGMAQYNDPFKIVYAITQGPGGPLGYILYASADRGRLFRSLDGGITWDMTMSLPRGSADTPWSIAADPHVAGTLYAGTFGNGVFVSYDYGEMWEQVAGGGLTNAGAVHVFDLEFDPEKMPQTLWAATAEGVFFTQDGGVTWAEKSQGLELEAVDGSTHIFKEARTLAFGKQNPGPFAAGTPALDYSLYTAVWGAGIFRLDGDRFDPYNPTEWDYVPLNVAQTNALLIHDGQLFVGTEGAGLMEYTVTASATANEQESAELPDGFTLEQNYPNPFNPVTTISFDMPESGDVRLAVYDMLGREVSILIDGAMASGRHTARFDAAGLPSGMYIYRLEAAGKTLANSMVLMK